jgi:hypothetical protein
MRVNTITDLLSVDVILYSPTNRDL